MGPSKWFSKAKHESLKEYTHDSMLDAAEKLNSLCSRYDIHHTIPISSVAFQDGERVLRLKPNISDHLPAADIHKRLVETVGEDYERFLRPEKNLYVMMKTPESARNKRGNTVKIGDSNHTLEFAGHHSTMYTCDDVNGVSNKALLDAMDHPEIATRIGIGLVRQRSNGPYAAFIFDEALDNCAKFTLRVAGYTLEFTPAQSQCPLCRDNHNGKEWKCDEMETVKDIAPPGGYFSEWHSKIQEWDKSFNRPYDLASTKVFKRWDWQYQTLQDFYQNYPALEAAKKSSKYRYLGRD